MQSINEGTGYISVRPIVSAARRRRQVHLELALKASTKAWAGPVAFSLLLFLASSVYVAFGGAYELASAAEAEIAITALAVEPADVGGAPRNKKVTGSSAEATDYFPSGYVNRGRDGDGNAMTYEHD